MFATIHMEVNSHNTMILILLLEEKGCNKNTAHKSAMPETQFTQVHV